MRGLGTLNHPKIVDFTPDHRCEVEPRIGSVEVNRCSLSTIIEDHIEATRRRNNELSESPVGMTTPLGSTRNVVEVVDPLDLKFYLSSRFDRGEIAPFVIHHRQFDHMAVGEWNDNPFLMALRIGFDARVSILAPTKVGTGNTLRPPHQAWRNGPLCAASVLVGRCHWGFRRPNRLAATA